VERSEGNAIGTERKGVEVLADLKKQRSSMDSTREEFASSGVNCEEGGGAL